MEQSINQHPASAYLIATSKLLERAGYYGARMLLVLFLTDYHGLDIIEALQIYGAFTMWVYLAQGLGGLAGDFAIGNRISVIIGGALQVCGLLLLAQGNPQFLQFALIIYALGAGLHGPNLLASFGKLYLKKRKLIDAGFTLIYMCINLGAALGIWYLAKYVGNFSMGFYICASLVAISLVPFLLTPKEEQNDASLPAPKFDSNSAFTMISVAVLTIAIFWTIFELTGSHQAIYSYDLKESFEVGTAPWWTDSGTINSVIVILSCLILFIIWSQKHISQFQKIAIGLIIASCAYVLYYFLPNQLGPGDSGLFLGGAVLLSIAEVFISAAALSVYALVSNPKRMASVFGLTALVNALFNKFISHPIGGNEAFESSNFAFIIAFITMALLSTAIFLFKQNFRPKTVRQNEPSLEDDELDDLDELGDID